MPSHCSSVIPIQYYMLWSAMCMYCGQPFLCLITQILQQEYTTKYIFCRVTVKYLILKKIKKKFLPLFWIVPTSTIWLCCVLLFALVLVVLGWVDTFCVFIFFLDLLLLLASDLKEGHFKVDSTGDPLNPPSCKGCTPAPCFCGQLLWQVNSRGDPLNPPSCKGCTPAPCLWTAEHFKKVH